MLCFLHIPDRPRLFSVCRTALKPGGGIYIEDYALRRPLTPQEAETLRTKVQCPYLPDVGTYESDLRGAGFTAVSLRDVTAEWTSFTADRLAGFRGARARQIAVHGEETVANLEDFYAAVAGLFAAGAITGVKILAR
jgi:SAM-dependent methyltransferase